MIACSSKLRTSRTKKRMRQKTYSYVIKYAGQYLARIRITPNSAFGNSQAQAPHITLDTVRDFSTGFPRDAFGSHITLASNIGPGNTSNKLAGYTKITNFDLATAVYQYVGGLHITMYDLMSVLEVLETHDGRQGDLAHDILWHAALIHLLNRIAVHVFETDVHGALVQKGAEKLNDERRDASMQNLQLSDDGLELGVCRLEKYLLDSHDGAGPRRIGRVIRRGWRLRGFGIGIGIGKLDLLQVCGETVIRVDVACFENGAVISRTEILNVLDLIGGHAYAQAGDEIDALVVDVCLVLEGDIILDEIIVVFGQSRVSAWILRAGRVWGSGDSSSAKAALDAKVGYVWHGPFWGAGTVGI